MKMKTTTSLYCTVLVIQCTVQRTCVALRAMDIYYKNRIIVGQNATIIYGTTIILDAFDNIYKLYFVFVEF